MKYFTTLLIFCAAHNSQQFQNHKESNIDVGEPLILTPLINANKTEEARTASEVHHDEFFGVQSYAGFLTVNDSLNSNMYFWFFPAEENYEEAPVIIYLDGGPGSSSLISLFLQIGPFEIQTNETLKLRSTYWSKTQSVIYFDNPVGTGFSFTDDGGYAKDQTQVGQQLVDALHQFFKIFPELRKNRFYAAGESYGGKYVPAVSYAILKSNPTAEVPINLVGLAIGNGLCDFSLQMNYADFVYQLGLVDSNGREQMRVLQDQIVDNLVKGNYQIGSDLLDTLLLADDSLFYQLTGFNYHFNFLYPEDDIYPFPVHMKAFLERLDVREALHVGMAPFGGAPVFENLHLDMLRPITSWVAELLEHYKIMFYTGQLDMQIPYPVIVNFFQHLNFSGAEDYKTAPREKWYVDGKLAGYSKQGGNLIEVLVRNAGHTAPYYQPKNTYNLISNFTSN